MSYALGTMYFLSIFILTAVVASVYSVAQEAWLTEHELTRKALKRAAKLLGVLLVLAVIVFLLSKV